MLVVTLARKPMVGSVAQAVVERGAGALAIGGCRIPTSEADAKAMERANTPGSWRMKRSGGLQGTKTFARSNPTGALDTRQGRWPSNLILQGSVVVSDLDAQGVAMGSHSAGVVRTKDVTSTYQASSYHAVTTRQMNRFGDDGGVSRFFFTVGIE